jgi:hypothetical protein
MHAEILQSKNFLDSPKHIRGGIVGGNHRALLHIGSNNESRAAICADVICSVLRVVLDDEDQCAVGIGTVGNLVHQQGRWKR